MQSPYLEGDNYYMNENAKSTESKTDLHRENNDVKEVIDNESLREQLNKTEEEIITLRQVLNVKLKLAQDLKRQLGITVINEVKGDIIHGINTIKESNTFKATTVVMKSVKDKTSSTLSTASTKFSQKLGMLRNTNTFKSIEGKMGTAYTSVKKVPCKYNPGDKIFAKVKGFVYWPARVNPLPEDIVIPPNKIPIFFFGTHEVFFISPTSCWPYDEKNKSKWGKPRPRAHFNQGMDEIENHTTIYQYGVDPFAEEFLSQFYQFKRSNGQNTTPNKLGKHQNNEVENDEEEEDISKESNKIKGNIDKEITKLSTVSKKRNKSGSSASMKENKNHSTKSNAMTELSVSDVKSEETNDIIELSQSIAPSKKRHISGSAMSAKENTNCEASTDIVNDMETTSVLIQDGGVTTRKRQSSTTSKSSKLNKPRAVSRKRQRNNVKEDLKLETEIDMNDDHPRTSMDCEITSKGLEGMKQGKDDQTSILECMTNSVVKLENNLDDKLIMEMLKKDGIDADKVSVKSEGSRHSDNSEDIKMPTTRCRNKSSSNKTSNSKPDAEKKLEVESDSPSVDSDNPDDEDFRPAPKVKRLTKKIRSPKQPKVIAKKSVGSQPKRTSKTKTPPKKKVALKVVSDDSLSSLSSVEDWKAMDEKQKNESEEKLKSVNVQQLPVEMSVKEVSKKTKEKRISDSSTVENQEIKNEMLKLETTDKNKEKSPEKLNVKENGDIGTKLNKEVVVNILKSDLISEDQNEETVVKDTLEQVFEDKDSKKSSESCEVPNEKVIKRNRKEKEKKSMVVVDSEEEEVKDIAELSNEIPSKVIENTNSQEKIKKVKINLKEMKVSKARGKPKPPPSRKRNRKLSSSSDSDLEVVKKEESKPKSKKAKIIERSSESDDNAKNEFKTSDKIPSDKLQILHNFNADIRSSLILGHEDYKTCLERFKSLCEMQIDLLSLVKVWQLMDTVKKCRRYKRNEQVKQEAQAVYKRFMDIYSQASKDEIAMAQSLLVQYRHQNNVQNQNVGNESYKTNGGLTIPISVADMFQNKLSYQFESNSSKSNVNHNKDESINNKQASVSVVSTAAIDVSEPHKFRLTPTEEEINEEKMRLLSVDLEAKVSDILNKIEKNVDVMNQKSLSHLLPSTDENLAIKLPTQWKSVNEKSVEKEKYVDDDNSDEDEEDVEAIVRRIEEVALKLPDPEPVSLDILNINGTGNSSALDARIENLFNNSFISSATVSTKDVRQKKSRVSSRHHNKTSAKSTSPLRVVPSQKLEQEPVVIKTSEIETPMIIPPVALSLLQEDKKDDIEIYDLLGV